MGTEAVVTLGLYVWLSGLAREVWRRSRELEVRDRQPALPACWKSGPGRGTVYLGQVAESSAAGGTQHMCRGPKVMKQRGQA